MSSSFSQTLTRTTWANLERTSLNPTARLHVPRPFTPMRTGSLMMSDGAPATWSARWDQELRAAPPAAAPAFAEAFAARANPGAPDDEFRSRALPPREPSVARPFGDSRLRGESFPTLPYTAAALHSKLPGHSFPTLPSRTSTRGASQFLGPVPTHGANARLLPTEARLRPQPHAPSASAEMRDWVLTAEPSRFTAQGAFTKYAHHSARFGIA